MKLSKSYLLLLLASLSVACAEDSDEDDSTGTSSASASGTMTGTSGSTSATTGISTGEGTTDGDDTTTDGDDTTTTDGDDTTTTDGDDTTTTTDGGTASESTGVGSSESGSESGSSTGDGSTGDGTTGGGSSSTGGDSSSSTGGELVIDLSVCATDHLILSEAVVTPTEGEFIEIYNPTDSAVDLTNYFLSDDIDYATFAGTGLDLGGSDFIAQFPSGATIGAGEFAVVALQSTDEFNGVYGVDPDFTFDPTDPGTAGVMVSQNIGATAGLTNGGEAIVLFEYDAAVAEVDIMEVGDASDANSVGMVASQVGEPGNGFSTKRIACEEGNETQTGGSGITGHDELTEDIAVTWDSEDTFTAPTPGE